MARPAKVVMAPTLGRAVRRVVSERSAFGRVRFFLSRYTPARNLRQSTSAAGAPLTVVLRRSHESNARRRAGSDTETSASTSVPSRRCGRARSAFARSCNCPSMCTGRPTRSIASRGRSSPRHRQRAGPGLRNRQDALGGAVRRAGRGGVARAPCDAGCASAVPRFRAGSPDRRWWQALRVRLRNPGVRRRRPLPRLPRRRAAHHRAQGRRSGAPAHLWFLESMDRINRAMQGTNDLGA